MRITDKKIYQMSADKLAPELLGVYLCRNINGKISRYEITETEAYCGESDTACHAHKGKTPRTKIMYESGGKAYIYLCYGIHNLLNIVCGKENNPHAVLIRGIKGFNGPGKLTKALNIDRSLNGENLILSKKLWLEEKTTCYKFNVSKRIGIDYADENDKNRLWRFIIDKNQ